MTGSKGQLRPQMRLQQLSLAYTSVSILLRKTGPSNIINYYSMPDDWQVGDDVSEYLIRDYLS